MNDPWTLSQSHIYLDILNDDLGQEANVFLPDLIYRIFLNNKFVTKHPYPSGEVGLGKL